MGRVAEKSLVFAALRSGAMLVSIGGPEGIGKTALALEVAHQCMRAERDTPRFEAGVWTSAAQRALSLEDVLDTLARVWGYTGLSRRTLPEKRREILNLLQTRPTLLIVDSFDQVVDHQLALFLLRLPAPSAAITTAPEHKPVQAWPVSLNRLVEADGVDLIRLKSACVGLTALERAENRDLLRLCQAVGGVPLAIKWAVGQIKRSDLSLDAALATLPRAAKILDDLVARSWAALSPQARRVLCAASLFAAPASQASIAAISDLHGADLDAALDQLLVMAMLEPIHESGQLPFYSLHPLTRAFAAGQWQENPAQRDQAQEHLLDFYHALLTEQTTYTQQEVTKILETELPSIAATLRKCWQRQILQPGASILFAIADWMARRGYWNDAIALNREGAALAAALGDELSAARFQTWFVRQRDRRWNDLQAAQRELEQALAVLERAEDAAAAARAKMDLGDIARERGELEMAERWLKGALGYYQSTRDEPMIFAITARLGQVALAQGYFDAAWALCHGVLASARRLGDPICIIELLVVLGMASHRCGDAAQSQACVEEAEQYLSWVPQGVTPTDVLYRLAQLASETGQERIAQDILSILPAA